MEELPDFQCMLALMQALAKLAIGKQLRGFG